MKVYVLEAGAYDEACILGVYATPLAAMAAWPEPSRPKTTFAARRVFDAATGRTTTVPGLKRSRHTYEWIKTADGWHFDAGSYDSAVITEYEVQT